MTPYTVTIPGSPGPASVNGWKRPIIRNGQATMVLGPKYLAWRNLAVSFMRAAMRGREPFVRACRVTVCAYWPKLHRKGPAAGLPWGDVDAVIKAVLDALQHADVFPTDALVTEAPPFKFHDPKNPRVEVSVEALR